MGKSKHKISNLQQYNQPLVQRGSLTIWMDEQAIQQWYCQSHNGRRGRGGHYSVDMMLKSLFKLLLRALEGFINSLFQLMSEPLHSPDYIDGRPGLLSPQSMKMSQVEIATIDPDFDRGYHLYP